MMVCNFTKPTHDKPSILTHDELRLFFHEFGNLIKQVKNSILSRIYKNTF